jgi:hypothetical protein
MALAKDYVTCTGELKFETPKAVQFELHTVGDIDMSEEPETHWFPKSQLDSWDMSELKAAKWILQAKELI